jgi:general stress protein CsbA
LFSSKGELIVGKTCNECKAERLPANVPYFVHEGTVARLERIIMRQWIALIIVVALLFASFGLFVWYESRFETITYDYTQDGQGTNIIGYDNEVNNGAKIESKD